MRKHVKKMITALLGAALLLAQSSVSFAAESEETVIELQEITDDNFLDGYEYAETFDMGNGFTCKVYAAVQNRNTRSSTADGDVTFTVYSGNNLVGYYHQVTSWSYDGTNAPKLLSSTDTFSSTDLSKNYVRAVSSGTSTDSLKTTQYAVVAKIYYNATYLTTSEFSTSCFTDGVIKYSYR